MEKNFVVVLKKTDSPRQDHSHKNSSIFKIYSFIYCSSKPSGTVGQTIRENVLQGTQGLIG